MPDPSKVLDAALGPYTNLFVAVACVAAVWLLLRDMGVGVSVSKAAGFDNPWGNASNNRLTQAGIVEVGYAPAVDRTYTYRDGFAGRKRRMMMHKKAGLGNNEPPVFWNPGSYAAVGDLQSAAIVDEGSDMNVNSDPTADLAAAVSDPSGTSVLGSGTAGFASRIEVPYVSGFSTSPADWRNLHSNGSFGM
jgi:hypothetical protein